ncbi:MAG: hypothetical protein M5U14_12675 [Acidimicrobiia bacterium]|nr:hypothetical protein [Acidimicrobiia bacterium]
MRFPEAEVRPVSRSAGGVRGIRLRGDDRVVGSCAVGEGETVVVAHELPYAKRLRVDELPAQARGGTGIRAARVVPSRGGLAAVSSLADRMTFVTADNGTATVEATAIKLAARDASGSRFPGVPETERLVRVLPAPAPRAEPG